MNVKPLFLVVAAGLLLAVGCNQQSVDNTNSSGSAAQSKESDDPIFIEDYNYSSNELTVKKGATVIWINNDDANHTVTADGPSGPKSELFGKGQTYSYTFNEVGVFPYYCEPHPYMTGVIRVD